MDAKQFDQQVGDLAATLGDATRRGIYITARQTPEPVTAGQIADLFGIHPNVARHHLDRLATDGYLRISRRPTAGRRGPGAGRPAKQYEPTDKAVSVEYPARRYDLLAELLAQLVERLSPGGAGDAAEEIGHQYGRQLAAEIGFPSDDGYEEAVKAVAAAMIGVGFETEARPADHELVTRFCPFGDTAARHPHLVCRIDQGIVRGLLDGTTGSQALVMPRSSPDENCHTEI
jgi:predicted ArsR family transcriptional regulator